MLIKSFNMLRFYAKRVGSEYVIMNDTTLAPKAKFTESELFECKSAFAEILVSSSHGPHTNFGIIGVNSLDVDEVKGPALRAADDHNFFKTSPVDKVNPGMELKKTFQEFIDRAHVYGSTFETEFETLLNKFPLKVAVKDNFYRTVSK